MMALVIVIVSLIGLVFLGGITAVVIIGVKVYRVNKRLNLINALVWRHPNHVAEHTPVLEEATEKDAPGGDWFYKPGRPPVSWFLGDKVVKWCYEKEKEIKKGEEGKDKEYELVPFLPEAYVTKTSQPSSELADTLDWTCAAPFIGKSMERWLKYIAFGSFAMVGIAAIIAMIFMTPFLAG